MKQEFLLSLLLSTPIFFPEDISHEVKQKKKYMCNMEMNEVKPSVFASGMIVYLKNQTRNQLEKLLETTREFTESRVQSSIQKMNSFHIYS